MSEIQTAAPPEVREPLWHERGGIAGPLLVLLHGLGAHGAVWDGMKATIATNWLGRWLVPDFRGHGRSSHLAPYSIESHAADVAALLEGENDVTLLGHSMGGLVAIALASGRYGVRPRQVFAFSVKTAWSAEELERAQAIAQAPVRWFENRAEAIDRHLRISGLKGRVDPDSPQAAIGISGRDGRFRLAADPRANGLGTPDIARIAADAKAPLHLLCGEQDGIATCEAMQRLGGPVIALPSLGHNLHVEAPDALWREVGRLSYT